MGSALWTSEEAAKATGGRAVGEWSVSGLSIDTRSLEAGDMFVPLKDARDGHDFIPMARERGAGAILSENFEEIAPALVVDDAEKALHDLAMAARERSNARRAAVTGSVGKTSLKEMIAHICTSAGKTHKSQKSFNNHWGVPFTLASMPHDAAYGVFELGMNHTGELAKLSPMVAPHVAVITKIAPAHLAHFSGIGEIAAAKSEIFKGFLTGGKAVLNADDDYFDFLSGRAAAMGADIISFGKSAGADVRLSNSQSSSGGVSGKLSIDGEMFDVKLGLTGEHWLENAACAFAACGALGIKPGACVKALSSFEPLSGRGATFSAEIGGKSVKIVDESYNANPESMRAAIEALGQAASGRKLAVLGDMYELGKDELALHGALSEPLETVGVSRVIFVGECMRALRGAVPQTMRGAWCRTWQDALDALGDEVHDGDTILVKGSNATGLGQLITALKNKTMEAANVL